MVIGAEGRELENAMFNGGVVSNGGVGPGSLNGPNRKHLPYRSLVESIPTLTLSRYMTELEGATQSCANGGMRYAGRRKLKDQRHPWEAFSAYNGMNDDQAAGFPWSMLRNGMAWHGSSTFKFPTPRLST